MRKRFLANYPSSWRKNGTESWCKTIYGEVILYYKLPYVKEFNRKNMKNVDKWAVFMRSGNFQVPNSVPGGDNFIVD